MTTAMEGSTATDTFVVRPDHETARRMRTMLLVCAAVVVAINLVALIGEDGGEVLWRGGTVVLWIVICAIQLVLWRRILAADALAEVGPTGIRVNDLGRGWVSLPWEAVARVRKDIWGRMVVKPAPGVGPGTPGTEWPGSASTARRARRRGLFILVRPSDAAANQVQAAVTHFSGGRL